MIGVSINREQMQLSKKPYHTAITIDGPAGVGKSFIASELAARLDFLLLQSGLFYRAMALGLSQRIAETGGNLFEICQEWRRAGESFSFLQKIMSLAEEQSISQIKNRVFLQESDVTESLGTPILDRYSLAISQFPPIRHLINQKLRALSMEQHLIAEGRDMGTVVFPFAQYKFFLEAEISVRAERRWEQLQKQTIGHNMTLVQIKREIEKRDLVDSNKIEGKLEKAPDAYIINSTNLTSDAVCQIIMEKSGF